MRPFVWLLLVVAPALGLPLTLDAQADPHNFRFNSGQTVGPIFEGWSRNDDGSYTMHFGYINRNWVEEIQIPVGPDNRVQPGDPDQGQPRFFYPRVNRHVFSVRVPATFGDQQLVWSLTVRGQTERAIAWLEPTWEIDPVLGGREPTDEQRRNQPPSFVLDAPATATLHDGLTIAVTVTDDGLPGPRRRGYRAPIGQESPPTLKAETDGPKAPVNVPSVHSGSRPSQVSLDERLRTTWFVWAGPASVEVVAASGSEEHALEDGRAVLRTRFTKPGEYRLRARLSDGHLTTTRDLPVTVTP